MKIGLRTGILAVALYGFLASAGAHAQFIGGDVPFPGGGDDIFPPEIFPEDFEPQFPDLPEIPQAQGAAFCFSIFEPSGETFSARGPSQAAAARRALAACKSWQNQNDEDDLGRCSILSCDTLIQ